MTFEGFSPVKFPPKRVGFVYVIFWADADGIEIPFYVGETDRLSGRMEDYHYPAFNAPVDFKVGEAIKYLQAKNYRIVVKSKLSDGPKADRTKEEKEIIRRLRAEGFRLLNSPEVPGYNYKTASEDEERLKVQKFCDGLLLGRSKAAPATG